MKIRNITENPWLLFSPFLFLLLVIVFLFQTAASFGDESRYIYFAQNLLQGFYSPPFPDIDLGNGPGYSILIIPFLAFQLPLICITAMNAVFYYISIVLLYKVLKQFVSFRLSLCISLFWAFYINAYEKVPLICPETLSVLLVVLIIYYLVKAFNNDNFPGTKKYLILSGIFIGYLALTKPIFGYVILIMIIGSGLL